MIRKLAILILTCVISNSRAQVNIITTICGNDTIGFAGDGGDAKYAKLNYPSGLCLDNNNNIYIADGFNHRIRKINLVTGSITTVVGTGIAGYNGDNILATDASLRLPEGVFTDSSGNFYIADALNDRIRKVSVATGIITTVAGNGISGFGGDGGQATDAKINGPSAVFVDKAGDIIISDYYNNRIRKVEAATGIINTIAGTGVAGYSGDYGLAINATIDRPCQAFSDSYGNIYFAEGGNSVLRKITISTGEITTVSGNGIPGYFGDGGLAVNAKLNWPYGLFIDSLNNIYIDEWGNGTIRRIDAVSNKISTVAGTGVQGFSGDGGPATLAKLQPDGVFLDKYGNMYIADVDNNRIPKVYNPELVVSISNASISYVKVYPVPASEELSIEYNLIDKEDALLQITDITGRIAINKILNANKQKEIVDIHGLLPGMYLYKVLQNNMHIATGKIIKE